MKFSTSRPETTELAISLFARSLHPELFETCERFELSNRSYQASVQITSFGHLVEFQSHGHFVTEVLDGKAAILPRIKRLCLYSAEQSRNLKYTLDSGVSVALCCECEYLMPDVFRRVEQEYWKDAQSATLAHLIDGRADEAGIGLSFVRVDANEDALGVHTFHLFPEEYAIVKTQSLYMTPAPERS